LTEPDVGLSKPQTKFKSVDFPEPEGPITATRSPAATWKLTRLRALTALSLP